MERFSINLDVLDKKDYPNRQITAYKCSNNGIVMYLVETYKGVVTFIDEEHYKKI